MQRRPRRLETERARSLTDAALLRGAFTFAHDAYRAEHGSWLGTRSVLHLMHVAELLGEAGERIEVVCAGVLHDTLERAPAGAEELQRRFGRDVAELVAAVSRDAGLAPDQRDGALRDQVQRYGGEAGVLLAADMISTTGDLTARRAAAIGARVDLAHYRRALAMLEHILPDHELIARLKTQLAALTTLAAPMHAAHA